MRVWLRRFPDENMTYRESHIDHGIFCYLYRKYHCAILHSPESRQKHLAKRLRICSRYARVEISALVRHVLAVKTQNLKISCENLTILVKDIANLDKKYNKKYAKQRESYGQSKQKRETQFQIRCDRESQRSYRPTRSYRCFPVWHGTASFIEYTGAMRTSAAF